MKDRLQTVSFPHEYHAEVLGEFAERQAAQGRLFAFGLAAALGIFLLLQTCIGSWRVAAFSFLTLPLALVGGVLAAFAAGGVISLGSLVGFLTVFGIAARNGILLVNHYQHLEDEEGQPFGIDLVLRGSRERLAPILMTALATGLALVPLVIRRDPRRRDRVPDGDRHPRRPRDLDAPEPVPRPDALPAVRAKARDSACVSRLRRCPAG